MIVDLLLSHEEVDYLERATRDAFDDPTTARVELLAALQRRRKPDAKRRHRAERTIDRLTEPASFG